MRYFHGVTMAGRSGIEDYCVFSLSPQTMRVRIMSQRQERFGARAASFALSDLAAVLCRNLPALKLCADKLWKIQLAYRQLRVSVCAIGLIDLI